jgi:methylmalonyl-CoA mutase N-terminal domain/subunit
LAALRAKYNAEPTQFEGRSRSGIPLPTVFGPEDVEGLDQDSVGYPGLFPYTRGIYPLQFQSTPWMNQQVHGYGTPEDTNERMRHLRAQGMSGYGGRPVFNLVFDLPTQEGYDADDPVSAGRVGQSGVSVSTVDDLDRVFASFDLDKINASLIMADPSLAILAMYIVLAERRGISAAALRGNTMNFLYNTFHFDRHGFPPPAAMRLIVELVRHVSREMPAWNSTNLCGYNIRESGASAVQELAYVLATGIAITEACVQAGLEADEFLPRFGFQIEVGDDLFEDICKIRALRRMWATTNRARFGATDERSMQARIHVHTSGADLTAQQPMVNIARAALHTLAAVMAGANSIQTSSYDEALGIPTEEAATLALRTQQVVRYETGVTNVTDPLGGSYYVEWLTDRMVVEAESQLSILEVEGGGFLNAWTSGWLRDRIADWAYRERQAQESGERVVVGQNMFTADEPEHWSVFAVSEDAERLQVERLRAFRAARDNDAVERGLAQLAAAVSDEGEIMPRVLECFRADATLGEVMGVFRDAWGRGSVY